MFDQSINKKCAQIIIMRGVKIDKTYVINLKHRKDRWQQINKNFEGTGLTLTKWDAISGKDLPDNYIKKVTTDFCYHLCSPGLIGCWLSHYTLWNHLVKQNEKNVLILEDDAFPTAHFNQRVDQILNDIPSNYDFVYFGCTGSCNPQINQLFHFWTGNSNQEIYIGNLKLGQLIYPIYPLATHAYLISNKGAKKLLNNKNMGKIFNHIDYTLATYIYQKTHKNDLNTFIMMAVNPPLINQGFAIDSEIAPPLHPIFSAPLSKMKILNTFSGDYLSNVQIAYIRKLSFPITLLFVIIVLISFILGLWFSNRVIVCYLSFLVVIYLMETIMTKNYRLMLFEMLTILIITLSSYYKIRALTK